MSTRPFHLSRSSGGFEETHSSIGATQKLDGTQSVLFPTIYHKTAATYSAILKADNIATADKTFNWPNNSGTVVASTVAQGDLFYGSAANVCASLAKDANATRYLANTGASNNPAWAQVDLTNGVTGDLPFANLAQIAGLSVLGVTGASTADVAGITAGTDHQVLRRSGSALAFGAVNLDSTDAVTGTLGVTNGGTNLASGTDGGILGFTGTTTLASSGLLAANQLMLGGGAGATPATLGSLGTSTTVLHGNAAGAPTFAAVSLSADVTGDLPFSSLAQGDALSVLGVAGNATADVASIAAGSDGQVLRRSGTAVGFGAVDLDSANSVTGTLGVANGGTNLASGTSGGVLAFTGSTTLASSAALGATQVVLGGGAGVVPYTSANLTFASDQLIANGSASTPLGAILRLVMDNTGANSRLEMETYTSDPGITGRVLLTQSRGTVASPSQTLNGDRLGSIWFRSTTATPGSFNNASIISSVAEADAGAAARLEFYTRNGAASTLAGTVGSDQSWTFEDAVVVGGMLSADSAAFTNPLGVASGGTSENLSTSLSSGGIVYSTSGAMAILAGTATAGRMLRSGASAAPSWSTATFPDVATGTGTILRADGTNWVATTATYPTTITTNQVLYATGTNAIGSGTGLTFSGTVLATTGIVNTGNGTAGAPAYSFTSDPDTGLFWRGTANRMAFTIGGTHQIEMMSNALFPLGASFTLGLSSDPYLNVFTQKLAIDTSATLGDEALIIKQDDADQGFIEFDGTSSADFANNISTVAGDGTVVGPKSSIAANGWTFTGMVRVVVEGSTVWMPYYSSDAFP